MSEHQVNDQESPEEDMVQTLYDLVMEHLNDGAPDEQLESVLVDYVFTQERAHLIVRVASSFRHASCHSIPGKYNVEKILKNTISQCIQKPTRNEVMSGLTRSNGMKHTLLGALWCIGGIIVTAISYNMASGGGTYIITTGAIAIGAIQFLYGVIQLFVDWTRAEILIDRVGSGDDTKR